MISCISQNGGIGFQDQLLFNIKTDLKRFKRLTEHQIVVMGRTTMDSIISRNGKPLPNRVNVVLSNTIDRYLDHPDIIVYNDIEALHEYINSQFLDVYIIGGAKIYKEFLNDVDQVELTHVEKTVLADTFFPIKELSKKFNMVSYIESEEDGLKFSFRSYKKK